MDPSDIASQRRVGLPSVQAALSLGLTRQKESRGVALGLASLRDKLDRQRPFGAKQLAPNPVRPARRFARQHHSGS